MITYDLNHPYVRTKRVKDSIGSWCLDCGQVFTTSTQPWHWRKAQAMHERGQGHTMKMFGVSGMVSS